jgi:chain length determinant protein (polysaccharide antigen chain regulator)
VTSTSDTQTASSDDEIDLVDLARSAWKHKSLIAMAIIACGFIATAYAFISKPVYEVKTYVLPPTINGIAEFNYGRTKEVHLNPFTVKDVYDVFIRNLQSEGLRRDFYTEVYIPSLTDTQRQGSKDVLYAEFSRQIVVGLPSTDSPNRYSIAVQSTDPTTATNWLNLFVNRANATALQEMISNVTSEAEVRARNLDQQIATLRQNGQGAREDTIAKLREALYVAESIGLDKPPIISGSLSSKSSNGTSANISANMDGPLTYMRGSEALKAEIKNLEERVSDDPFIPKLRSLEVQQSYFRSISVKPDSVSVYRQDGPIELPDRPIKPKKTLIIGMGLVFGLILGLVLAMARHFVGVQMVRFTESKGVGRR